MRLITRDEAAEAIEPYRAAYLEAHLRSFDRYMTEAVENPEFIAPIGSGSRYSVLHDHIVADIQENVPNTFWTKGGPPVLLHVIEGAAVVRFKLLNGAGLRPSFNSTDRQDRLMEQQYTPELMEQLQLQGVADPLTALVCGYQLTQSEDAILDVVVACHTPQLQYFISLMGGESAEMLTFPTIDPVQPRVASKLVQEQGERPADPA